MKSKSNIIVALSRVPYPSDKGDKLRAYYQLLELVNKYNVYLVCLTDSDVDESSVVHLKSFCTEVHIIKLGLATRLLNLLFGLINTVPFQTNYFRSKKMEALIAGLSKNKAIELCYVQLIRLHKNLPFIGPTKYYLDYMDAFSLGMKKRAKKSGFFKRYLVDLEATRLEHFEPAIAPYYDGYSIITEKDSKAFSELVPLPIDVIPNGITNDFLKVNPVEGVYDVVFLGNMGYFPNVEAAKYLVGNILPILQESIPNAKVCLVGTNPAPEVRKLESEHVVVTGFVEDVSEYLAKSKVFVAPLFTGQGLQNKLLESLAVGIPVITTPLAYAAFECPENSGMLMADCPEDFAKFAVDLIQNKAERTRLGDIGQVFVKTSYDWAKSTEKLIERFEEIIHGEDGTDRIGSH